MLPVQDDLNSFVVASSRGSVFIGRTSNITIIMRFLPRSISTSKILGTTLVIGLLGGTLQAAEPKPVAPKAPPLTPAANNHIAIPKAALGKEFLISASIIPQVQSPTSTGLAGKLVRFELFHDGVDLYESTAGLVVTDDLPSRRLLTTFPIISQDAEKVVIDFNAGMKRVFTEIWYSGGGAFNPTGASRTMEIPQSRVFEVQTQADQLIIRQSAQARDRANDPNREERYEIRYFIAPYSPGDFQTKENGVSESRYVRFFEAQSQLETTTGRPSAKIALFDIRKPVTIYYSANTPTEYEDAVKDGILYWNRAFGKDVVKAEKAPAGVTAPDARYNIVQWVPWDNAGSAYADVLIDPRTGASQHGQAYMTSVFAIGGRARARALLRAMRSVTDAKPVAPVKSATGESQPGPTSLSIPFLSSARACEMDPVEFAQQYAAGLESMLADGGFDDEAAKRASQDYVRQVVAHEVGHVLGLRHNFAGSIAATLNHKQLDEWFKSYVTNDNTQLYAEGLSTSSIMEYTVLKASIFAGSKIRKTKEVLPHDKAAIRWGYFNETEASDKKMLFGTDGDVATYGDLQRFDYGVEPVVSAYANVGELVRNLPNSIIETFIRARAPRDPRDKRPLEEVNLNPTSYVAQVAGSYADLLTWFKAGTRSLRVENAFQFVGELNHKEILEAHWNSLTNQIEKLGGIDRAAFSFLPVDLKLELKAEPKDVEVAEKIDAKKLNERLAKLLESPAYAKFTGLDEKPYSFTKEEKELIIKRGKKFFEEFEKDVIKRSCQTLEKASRDLGVQALETVGDDDVVAKLEKRIIDYAKEVIMTRNEDDRRRGKVDKAYVEVSDFKYDLDTRLAAARMLSDNIGSFKGWAVDAKADLNKSLKDAVDAALNAQNFRDFQESILSRPLRDWYLNQQAVLALLPPKRPTPPSVPAPTPAPGR